LPRDLSDVADYFLPGASRSPRRRAREPGGDAAPKRAERPAALPIVGLPMGERDVVRAAFAWNLAVEVARLGGGSSLVTPRSEAGATVWPDPGPGPLGAELVLAPASGLSDLARAALDVAVERAADNDAGVVLARIPPDWLGAAQGRAVLRWVLLFSSTDRHDLLDTYALAKRVLVANRGARVGVTIHGAQRIADAERAFAHLADVSSRHLGRSVSSYGMLVDDLHVYRAIVSRRPIGLEHPQSRAARALRDVARLVLEDARASAVA
jgi:hypothetical protein